MRSFTSSRSAGGISTRWPNLPADSLGGCAEDLLLGVLDVLRELVPRLREEVESRGYLGELLARGAFAQLDRRAEDVAEPIDGCSAPWSYSARGRAVASVKSTLGRSGNHFVMSLVASTMSG